MRRALPPVRQVASAAAMAVTLVILPGCAKNELLRYGVEIRNATSERINDVSVNFDGFEAGVGLVVPGAFKSYHYVPRPVPRVATVVWRTGDGRLHQLDVSVPTVSRKHIQDGSLVFTITDADDDVVEVEAEPAPPPIPKYNPKYDR